MPSNLVEKELQEYKIPTVLALRPLLIILRANANFRLQAKLGQVQDSQIIMVFRESATVAWLMIINIACIQSKKKTIKSKYLFKHSKSKHIWEEKTQILWVWMKEKKP